LIGVPAAVFSLGQASAVDWHNGSLLLVVGCLLGGYLWLIPASLAIPQGRTR